MTDMPDTDPILARVSPSVPRRVLGVSILSILGGTLIYVAMARPAEALGWQLFLLALGAGALALAGLQMRATARGLELTATELREIGGRQIATVALVERVERGAFAVKPSNGFLLRLSSAHPDGNSWAPGLWWRLGRRVGVGGITSPAEGRAMAEILTAMIAERARGRL